MIELLISIAAAAIGAYFMHALIELVRRGDEARLVNPALLYERARKFHPAQAPAGQVEQVTLPHVERFPADEWEDRRRRRQCPPYDES